MLASGNGHTTMVIPSHCIPLYLHYLVFPTTMQACHVSFLAETIILFHHNTCVPWPASHGMTDVEWISKGSGIGKYTTCTCTCISIILCTNTSTCTAIGFEPHLREPHLALTKHTVTKHFFLPHVCALPASTTESPLYIIFTTITPCYYRVAVVYYVPPCVHTWTCIWVDYLHC